MSVKKGKNPVLLNLLKEGNNKEQSITSTGTKNATESSSIEESTPEAIELSTITDNSDHPLQELPEEKKESISLPNVSEEKLPEKKNVQGNVDNKKQYADIIHPRNKKESVEKANLITSHRDLLKRISTAENIPMQDLLANILDEFRERYESNIKNSIKKLMI